MLNLVELSSALEGGAYSENHILLSTSTYSTVDCNYSINCNQQKD